MKRKLINLWCIISLVSILAMTNTFADTIPFEGTNPLINVYHIQHFKTKEYLMESAKQEIFQNRLEVWEYYKSKVNETGKVMIVMYHRLGDKNGSYLRKIDDFKSDLLRLYEEGYTLISMDDYINGTYHVPMGRTPIVLTFDDGHISNFRYLDDSDAGILQIDPECVVGIIDAFYEEHPEFGRHAIFYLNKDNPFGQPEYLSSKLSYLIENGYEVGNHTMHHLSLAELDAEGIQEAIGGNVNYYDSIEPGYHITSLALPFGIRPDDDKLRAYIFNGIYDQVAYENKLALLVGWRPEKPLYLYESGPYTLNRVQSGDDEYQLSWWLDYFKAHPDERFYSDGDPDRVSIPKEDTPIYGLTPYVIPTFRMGG